MKKFVVKLVLISLPVFIMLAVYFYKDPNKTLYYYDRFYQSEKHYNSVSLNRDYISTETFLRNSKKINYDSYILGSSRSMSYDTRVWEQYISHGKCFHFNGWNEGVYGVEKKLKFLSERKQPIRNVIIVLDNELLLRTENGEGIERKHPLVSGESRLMFQLHMLRSFFDVPFLREYLYFVFSGSLPKDAFYIDDFYKTYDSVTNEIKTPLALQQYLETKADSYYVAKPFYERDQEVKYHPRAVTKPEQIQMLESIRDILKKNNTNYKIVINPLYDQRKIDTNDLSLLCSLFNKKNVFDFSGQNDLTQTKFNYIDFSHYKPCVAAEIMDRIYADDRRNSSQKSRVAEVADDSSHTRGTNTY
ncbi:MAG: hypothetical protein K0R82_415 [Flavipsychrobacter sp.]|jgi:hypothetical protein|nr:hypothetical protein [Flavipsychrobacter sp.]